MQTKTLIVVAAGITTAGFFLYHSFLSTLPPIKPQPQEEAKRISAACADVSGDQTAHEKCTAHQFADAGERWGVGYIGDVLASYQQLNTGYQNYQNCHVLAHRITNDLVARDPSKWKELIAQMSAGQLSPNSCGGGFLHGVLEGHASAEPDFKINAALFKELCTDTVKPEVSSSCAHILGHLALVGADGDITQAFTACDGLSGDFLFQCYGGIFMEDSMRTNLNAHGLADLPQRNLGWLDAQVKRCDRYAGKKEKATGCWYDLPEVFLQTHNYDLAKTYAFCKDAPSKEAYNRCYIRASYLVAITPDTLFATSSPKALCAAYSSGSPELSQCMQEVVGAALTGSMSFTDRMVAFCKARPNTVQAQCFGIIAGYGAKI